MCSSSSKPRGNVIRKDEAKVFCLCHAVTSPMGAKCTKMLLPQQGVLMHDLSQCRRCFFPPMSAGRLISNFFFFRIVVVLYLFGV